MEKLATIGVVLLMAVLGFCSELSSDKNESFKKNTDIGNHVPYHVPSEKAKFLPVKIVSEGGSRKKSTESILRHIGMSKMRSPANNHRKRLASQSRKSHNEKHLADSHIYIIKLPPNRYYYGSDDGKSSQSQSINRINLDFKSNGKPGKIYHWNLPVIKKMLGRKTSASKTTPEHDANQIIKSGPIWPKEEQPLHYRKATYYKPKKPSKQAFHKYFPGNGKPHSLYVIERNRRPNQNHRTH